MSFRVRTMSLVTRVAIVGLVLGVTSSCDACRGVSPCGLDTGRVVVDGRLLAPESGQAIRGAAIDLIAVQFTSTDSGRTVTDEDGLFHFALKAEAAQTQKLRLRVSPEGQPSYVIDSLSCSSVRQGAPCLLDPIIERPVFPIFRFVYRNDPARAVAGVRVRFVPTGGTPVVGPTAVDTFDVFTDISGTVTLFPFGVFAAGLAPVRGDLIVDLPAPMTRTLLRDYRVNPTARFGPRPLAAQAVGPGLTYQMVFSDSASGHGRAGIELSFERTGGIQGTRESFITTSNALGLAGFPMLPLEEGTMTGTFRIRVPESETILTLTDVSLATFDADTAIVFKRWSIGTTGVLYPVTSPP